MVGFSCLSLQTNSGLVPQTGPLLNPYSIFPKYSQVRVISPFDGIYSELLTELLNKLLLNKTNSIFR